MTLHRPLVLLLLAVTTVLALLYLSTFPAEPGAHPPEISGPDPQPAGRGAPLPAAVPERASGGLYARTAGNDRQA